MSAEYAVMRRRGAVTLALVAGLIATVLWPLSGTSEAATRSSYTTFFGTSSTYSDAGWAACPGPVTWTIDVNGMKRVPARQEIRKVRAALERWSAESAVQIRYDGRQDLRWDADANSLKPADGSAVRQRHVYIGFFGSKAVPSLSGSVVGLAMPTHVLDNRITGGMAVFRRGYVLRERGATPSHLPSLYMHELGHVMGLGHSPSDANVMYSTLGTKTELGPGDRLGVRTVTKECAS